MRRGLILLAATLALGCAKPERAPEPPPIPPPPGALCYPVVWDEERMIAIAICVFPLERVPRESPKYEL